MRRCRQRGRKVAGAGRRGPRLDDPRAVGDVVKHDLYGFRPACARGDRSDGADVYGRKCKRERDGIAVGVVVGYDGRPDAIGVDVDAWGGGGDDRGGVWTDQDIVDDSRLVVGRGGGLQPKVGRRRGAVADPHGVYGRILPCCNRAVVRCRSGPRRAIGRMLEGEHGRRTAGKQHAERGAGVLRRVYGCEGRCLAAGRGAAPGGGERRRAVGAGSRRGPPVAAARHYPRSGARPEPVREPLRVVGRGQLRPNAGQAVERHDARQRLIPPARPNGGKVRERVGRVRRAAPPPQLVQRPPYRRRRVVDCVAALVGGVVHVPQGRGDPAGRAVGKVGDIPSCLLYCPLKVNGNVVLVVSSIGAVHGQEWKKMGPALAPSTGRASSSGDAESARVAHGIGRAGLRVRRAHHVVAVLAEDRGGIPLGPTTVAGPDF